MRPTTILIALLAALAGSAAPLAGAGAKEFRSSDVHPLDYPTVQAVMYMGKLIGERTGGKNSIKVFGQSTLGSEKDTIEQTKIGALDMVRVNVAPFNNIVPATIVPSLPFLFKSTAHMRKRARRADRRRDPGRHGERRASSACASTIRARAPSIPARRRSRTSPTPRA